MNMPELPKGLTSVVLIIAGWVGGYIHAQASNSAPAPQGPYRSVPQENTASSMPTPAPTYQGQHFPGQHRQAQPGPWGAPPASNAYQQQAFRQPPDYPSVEERQKQWDAYQNEMKKRQEEAHKQWQAQQADMQKRHAEFEKKRKEQFARMEKQRGQITPPTEADRKKQWEEQQLQWQARRKKFEEQHKKDMQAREQQRQQWQKQQEEFYKKNAPAGMQRPGWAQSDRVHRPQPDWNDENWKTRQEAFEKRRQEFLANRPQPSAYQDWAQRSRPSYPINPYARQGQQPRAPFSGPRFDPRSTAPQKHQNWTRAPQYQAYPNPAGPGRGYYPQPWFNRGYNYGPRW